MGAWGAWAGASEEAASHMILWSGYLLAEYEKLIAGE